MDDRQIVGAIVDGDLSGLAAYDEYAGSLYGYCRWMLAEPEDAADAVENTFIIAAGRLDRLRDPRKLRPWLFAVARNECHSQLRPSEVGLGEDTSLLFDRPLVHGGLRFMAMIGRLRASCSHRDRFCCPTPVSRASCDALTTLLPMSR